MSINREIESLIEDAIKEQAEKFDFEDQINEAVDNYDFDEKISDAVGNYDFEQDIHNAVREIDFSDDVADAVSDFDMSDHIEKAFKNYKSLQEDVQEVANDYLHSSEFSNLLTSKINDYISGRIAFALREEDLRLNWFGRLLQYLTTY